MPIAGAGIPITTLRMVLIALRACRLSEAVFVYDNTSYPANRTPQIGRFRSTLPRFAEWCATSGEKKGRWAAGWGVPLPESFPSPPISPCFLRRPPPFRCERSEQRNLLPPWQDLGSCERSERRNPLHPRQDLGRCGYPLVPRKSYPASRTPQIKKSRHDVTALRCILLEIGRIISSLPRRP